MRRLLTVFAVFAFVPVMGARAQSATPDSLTARGILRAALASPDSLLPLLAKRDPMLDAHDATGDRALHLAARGGRTGAALALYLHGAELRVTNGAGHTAAEVADSAGQASTARLLRGLDTTLVVEMRDTSAVAPDSALPQAALEYAVAGGYGELTAALLKLGLSPDERLRVVTGIVQQQTPLMLAADKGEMAITRLLVDAGADLYARDAKGLTALRHAALAGHYDVARLLIARTADLDVRDADGRTDLLWAASQRQDSLGVALLDAGAHQVADGSGQSPLHRAAASGADVLLDALLARGADAGDRTPSGATAFGKALRTGTYYGALSVAYALRARPGALAALRDSVRRMTAAFDDSLAQVRDSARTAKLRGDRDFLGFVARALQSPMTLGVALLGEAAGLGRTDRVRALLAAGVKPLAPGGFLPPLVAAARRGHDEAAIALVARGADVGGTDPSGWTALHFAARDGRQALVDTLLAHGADPAATGRDGWTPLALAANTGNVSGVAAMLLASQRARIALPHAIEIVTAAMRADSDSLRLVSDTAARSALAARVERGRMMLRVLQQPGRAGELLLAESAWRGDTTRMRALLANHVPPDAESWYGVPALLLALDQGHDRAAVLLLDAGADASAVTDDGRTALHRAAAQGLAGAVAALVRHGANANVATSAGETPLVTAALAGRADVVALLTRDPHARLVADSVLRARGDAALYRIPEVIVAQLEGRGPRWRPATDSASLAFFQAAASPMPTMLFDGTGISSNVREATLGALAGRLPDVNVRQADDWTPLMLAARQGLPQVVGQLVRAGASVSAVASAAMFSVLHAGVASGSCEVVHTLLAADAAPDVSTTHGWTPLIEATGLPERTTRQMVHVSAQGGGSEQWVASAGCGRDAVALLLVAAGADPHRAAAGGRDAVAQAELAGQTSLADALAGRRPDAVINNAIALGYVDQVDSLLARGVVPTSASVSAAIRAPLDRDVQRALVTRFIARGARLAVRDTAADGGRQPLHFAAMAGDSMLVAEVLRAGAAVDATDDEGETPLMLAMGNGSPPVAALLLRAGADVNARDHSGSTALHHAASAGDTAAIDLLVRHRARADLARTTDGRTPLMLAARRPGASAIRRLLAAGASVAAQDSAGETALHHAARDGDVATVSALLDAGAAVDVRSRAGTTALLAALRSAGGESFSPGERSAVAQRLLERAADGTARDSGLSAIQLAAANGLTPIAQLLVARGANPWEGSPSAVELAADSAHDVTVAVLACGMPSGGVAGVQLTEATGAVLAAMKRAGACTPEGARGVARDAARVRDAELALARGDVPAAEALAVSAGGTIRSMLPLLHPLRMQDAIVLARARVARGHANDVVALLREESGPAGNPTGDERRAELYTVNGDAWMQAGFPGTAMLLYRSARLETEREPDAGAPLVGVELDRGVRGTLREAYANAVLGDVEAARTLLADALQHVHTDMPSGFSSLFLATVGEMALRQRDARRAADLFAGAADESPLHPSESFTKLDAWLGEGRALRMAGDTAQARLRFARAVAIARRERGARTPLVGQALDELALLDDPGGDADVELALLTASTSVRELGRPNLGALLIPRVRARRGAAEIVALEEQLAVMRARLLTDALESDVTLLSAATQRAYVAEVFPAVRDAMLGLRDSTARRNGYRVLSRWKGMLVFLLGQRSTDTAAAASQVRLAAARARLAAWVVRRREVPAAQWAARYRALTAEKESAERELGLSLGAKRANPDPLATASIDTALASGTALVDLYRHGAASGDTVYSAVVSAAGVQRIVAVAPAGALDSAVVLWRLAVSRGDPADAQWTRLVGLVWAPIARVLPARTRELWVSPDGSLSTLPWQVLAPLPHVAVVPSPREVLRALALPDDKVARPTLLAVGGVNFDAGAQAREAGHPFPSLPGTAAEASAIAAKARSRGVAATLLEGSAATKPSVLAAMPRATWVHIGTHGFFDASRSDALPDSRGTRGVEDDDEVAPEVERTSRNPLLESGLALAGANARSGSAGGGILTAEELVGLDLSRTRLVVLSACETALGTRVDGQGVQGLQSALLASGANGMLMSLWKVPDAATALLMTSFYEALWTRGLSPADALRAAQERVRSDPRYRAPVNWAAWVLVGRVW